MLFYTPDPEWREVDYAGPAVIAAGANHPILRMTLFRSPAASQRNARRVIVMPQASGLRHTGLPSLITNNLDPLLGPVSVGGSIELTAVMFLDCGFDVILASMPIARGDAGTGNSKETGNPESDTEFSIDSWAETPTFTPRYGPAYDGNGMIVPATNDAFSLPASYQPSGGPHPMRDPARLNCYQAMTMLTQFILGNAVRMGYDPTVENWLGAYAASGGADTAAWMLGVERATYHFPGGVGQDSIPTRNAFGFMILHSWQSYAPAFPSSFYLSSIARRPSAGGDPHYDTQSATISQAGTAQMATWSALSYATHASVIDDNKLVKFHFAAGENSAMGAPFDNTNTAAVASTHDNWFVIAAALALSGDHNVRLVFTDIDPATEADAIAEGADIYRNALSPDELVDDVKRWLQAITGENLVSDPTPMRPVPAMPIAAHNKGSATFLSGTVDDEGIEVLGFAGDRRLGVWVSNVGADDLLVGHDEDSATWSLAPAATGEQPNSVFIPGQGPLWLKAGASQTDYSLFWF